MLNPKKDSIITLKELTTASTLKEKFESLCVAIEFSNELSIVQDILNKTPDLLMDNYGVNNPLLLAVQKGQIDLIKLLLSFDKKKIYLYKSLSQSYRGFTKIMLPMLAALNGHFEIFKCIMAVDTSGIFWNSKEPLSGNSLFHMTILGGNVEIVRLMIQNADMIYKNRSSSNKQSDTQNNVELACLEMITCTNKQGFTSLHLAAQEGHWNIFEMLAKRAPQVLGTCTSNGKTLLMLVALNYNHLRQKERQEILQYLLQNDPLQCLEIDEDNNSIFNLLNLSTMGGMSKRLQQHLFEIFTQSESGKIFTTLQREEQYQNALWKKLSGKVDILRYQIQKTLFESIKPVDPKTKSANPPLNPKIITEFFALVEENNAYTIDKMIIDCPSLIYATDELGNTALMKATKKNNVLVVRCLLNHASKNPDGDIPLHYRTNALQWTAAHYAAAYGHLELLDYLLRLDKLNRLCLDRVATTGYTVVQLATESGHLNVVRYLLENHPQKEILLHSCYGVEPLTYIALRNGRSEIYQYLNTYSYCPAINADGTLLVRAALHTLDKPSFQPEMVANIVNTSVLQLFRVDGKDPFLDIAKLFLPQIKLSKQLINLMYEALVQFMQKLQRDPLLIRKQLIQEFENIMQNRDKILAIIKRVEKSIEQVAEHSKFVEATNNNGNSSTNSNNANGCVNGNGVGNNINTGSQPLSGNKRTRDQADLDSTPSNTPNLTNGDDNGSIVGEIEIPASKKLKT